MNEFGRLLEKEIPRLRRYAFALTRNMPRADDLVQDTLVRAIVKQGCWQWGTNLRAWLFTLMAVPSRTRRRTPFTLWLCDGSERRNGGDERCGYREPPAGAPTFRPAGCYGNILNYIVGPDRPLRRWQPWRSATATAVGQAKKALGDAGEAAHRG
jgi:hypothetical protein